jgi:hypothetical protein
MRFTLITQVLLLSLSSAIIFLFIKPAFGEIKTIQDNVLVYSDAVEKASDYNDRLKELLALRDSFSQNDLAKLERFIPSSIDDVAVMHEIEAIFASQGIEITTLSAKEVPVAVIQVFVEGGVLQENIDATTVAQDFEVVFTGSYDTLKVVLGVLESNARLLEVIGIQYGTVSTAPVVVDEKMSQNPDDQRFTIKLRTYALQALITQSPTP